MPAGFNWMSYYGGKFSTSQRRGVFMDEALEILPADYWRYFLLSSAPESSDSDFTWDRFATTVNKDLADVLGNFVSRVTSFAKRKFGEKVPEQGSILEPERELAAQLVEAVSRYGRSLEEMQFRQAIRELRAAWVLGNTYIDQVTPWQTAKTDLARTACILRTALNLIWIYGVISWPIVPETSENLLGRAGTGESSFEWPDGDRLREMLFARGGRPIEDPGILFEKVTSDRVESWESRFQGQRGDRGT